MARGAGIAQHLVTYLSCTQETESEACLNCPLNASLINWDETPTICDAFADIDEAGELLIDQREGGN